MAVNPPKHLVTTIRLFLLTWHTIQDKTRQDTEDKRTQRREEKRREDRTREEKRREEKRREEKRRTNHPTKNQLCECRIDLQNDSAEYVVGPS